MPYVIGLKHGYVQVCYPMEMTVGADVWEAQRAADAMHVYFSK